MTPTFSTGLYLSINTETLECKLSIAFAIMKKDGNDREKNKGIYIAESIRQNKPLREVRLVLTPAASIQ